MGIGKTILKEISKAIATAPVIVGAAVTAKVGHAFYTVSQLPTAAAFGKACLATLKGSALSVGLCAGVAVVVDGLCEVVIQAIIKNKGAENSNKAKALGYLAKRAITIVAVVATALIVGSSPIVPIATIIVLLARDLLGKLIDKARNCKSKKVPTPPTNIGSGTKTDDIDNKDIDKKDKDVKNKDKKTKKTPLEFFNEIEGAIIINIEHKDIFTEERKKEIVRHAAFLLKEIPEEQRSPNSIIMNKYLDNRQLCNVYIEIFELAKTLSAIKEKLSKNEALEINELADGYNILEEELLKLKDEEITKDHLQITQMAKLMQRLDTENVTTYSIITNTITEDNDQKEKAEKIQLAINAAIDELK